mmetsp:Transcript_28776/g.61972  ORF Transcript_28776/g.61972 Transcript_28776/m.61972 type:complete len:576 (+) Transcript_28776:652-2379(+)
MSQRRTHRGGNGPPLGRRGGRVGIRNAIDRPHHEQRGCAAVEHTLSPAGSRTVRAVVRQSNPAARGPRGHPRHRLHLPLRPGDRPARFPRAVLRPIGKSRAPPLLRIESREGTRVPQSRRGEPRRNGPDGGPDLRGRVGRPRRRHERRRRRTPRRVRRPVLRRRSGRVVPADRTLDPPPYDGPPPPCVDGRSVDLQGGAVAVLPRASPALRHRDAPPHGHVRSFEALRVSLHRRTAPAVRSLASTGAVPLHLGRFRGRLRDEPVHESRRRIHRRRLPFEDRGFGQRAAAVSRRLHGIRSQRTVPRVLHREFGTHRRLRELRVEGAGVRRAVRINVVAAIHGMVRRGQRGAALEESGSAHGRTLRRLAAFSVRRRCCCRRFRCRWKRKRVGGVPRPGNRLLSRRRIVLRRNPPARPPGHRRPPPHRLHRAGRVAPGRVRRVRFGELERRRGRAVDHAAGGTVGGSHPGLRGGRRGRVRRDGPEADAAGGVVRVALRVQGRELQERIAGATESGGRGIRRRLEEIEGAERAPPSVDGIRHDVVAIRFRHAAGRGGEVGGRGKGVPGGVHFRISQIGS